MPRRPDPRALRRALVLAVASLAWACAGDEGPTRDPSSATAESDGAAGGAAEAGRPCSVTEQSREPVVLPNENNVYVHARGITRFGAGYALLGSPVMEYVVEQGRGRIVGETRFQGVIVEPGRPVRTIPLMPGVGTSDWVRAVERADGRLSVMASEVAESFPGNHPPLRIVHGVYDGDRWSLVETVPIANIAEVEMATSSEVVRVGSDVAWAALRKPSRSMPPYPVTVYRRLASGWTLTEPLRHYPDRLMLHAAVEGLMLGVAGMEAASGYQRVALALYPADAREAAVTFRVGDDGRPRRPVAVELAQGTAVAWVVEAPDEQVTWVALPVEDGRWTRPTRVAEGTEFISMVALGSDAVLLALDRHDRLTGSRELRLYRVDATGASILATMPNPFFEALYLLWSSPTEVLLMGGEPHLGTVAPFVRSLVIRLSVSC